MASQLAFDVVVKQGGWIDIMAPFWVASKRFFTQWPFNTSLCWAIVGTFVGNGTWVMNRQCKRRPLAGLHVCGNHRKGRPMMAVHVYFQKEIQAVEGVESPQCLVLFNVFWRGGELPSPLPCWFSPCAIRP